MSVTFTGFPEEGLRFLRALKRNNNREWFQAHKSDYEEFIKKPMEGLVLSLGSDLSKIAPEIVATPKASLFRIYRDTRFSKDKSPYKTHVAASFPHRGLDKHQGAGLYLHIAPTEVFLGGGIYMPASEDLSAVRHHIAGNIPRFKRILGEKAFRKTFGVLRGDQLLRVPKGFASDHPAADYLRYKQYIVSRTLEPQDATKEAFYKTLLETFRTMMPFVRFLNEPIVRAQKTQTRQKAFLSSD